MNDPLITALHDARRRETAAQRALGNAMLERRRAEALVERAKTWRELEAAESLVRKLQDKAARITIDNPRGEHVR